jgi:hypothetical protein
MLTFDIECDGLLDTLTKIHCIVIIDGEGNVKRYHESLELRRDGDIFAGVCMLNAADYIVCHNIWGYDLKVLQRFFPGFKPKKVHDTFILSQMLFPNEMSKHGLDAWGKVFGLPKPVHEDWATFSDEMLERCTVDTIITHRLWLRCKQELEGWDWSRAVEIEYKMYSIFCDHMTHWFIDKEKITSHIGYLAEEISNIDQQLESLLPYITVKKVENIPLRTQAGSVSSRAAKYLGEQLALAWGDFSYVEYTKLNLNSSQQVVRWLLSLGWQPEPFSKALPSIKDSALVGVPTHIKDFFVRRNIVKHRLAVLKGWESSLFEGNKIATFALTCGTPTARFRHMGVVNVPRPDVYFGKEMRELFVASDGYVLVGCDASQLEARIEGHFSYKYDGGEYAKFLLEQDIHQFNADRWGLTRQQAKGPGYALSYQCGPQKIADLLGISRIEGEKIHKTYWDDRPALRALVRDLERSVLSRGQAKAHSRGISLDLKTKPWIKGIDGRKLYVRSAHSMKNALIQSTGMIAVKLAVIFLAETLKQFDARIVFLCHDEIIVMCRPSDSITISKLCEESLEQARQELGLKVALVGQSKVGKSWYECH